MGRGEGRPTNKRYMPATVCIKSHAFLSVNHLSYDSIAEKYR